MQSSRLRMSQLTPPEELHTVAYVFTNGGPQMRSDEVTPVAKGHRSKKKHSRKSKRHSSSKRRKSMSLWLDKQEGATIWSCCKMGQNTPILQLNLFIWFPDANVTHNVHEEKIKNGQPAPGNVIAAVPTALTNMAGAGISSMSIRDQYAAVTHNIHEEKINNSQPATDNILSTAPPWLGAMAAAGIPSTSMRDLWIYLWCWHNALTSLLNLFPWFPDAAVTHNVHEERINNSQPATNNILSTAPPWLGAMAAAGISSMSMRDLNIRWSPGISSPDFSDNFLETLNLFTWLPHAPVNHNVHEEGMENGQPQRDNVVSNVLSGLINMTGAGIPFPDATITHNICEERMENGQSPDKFLSTITAGLMNFTGAGISLMSTRDQYATITYNVPEEKMEKGQPQPDNVLSTASTGLINVAGACGFIVLSFVDATVNHHVHEARMENGQTQQDNVLSNVLSGLINVAGTSIPAMSSRDLDIYVCGWHNALTSQLDLFIWFPDATVNHHVHEARMENGQPQQGNVLSNVLSGLINVAGASIPAMSSRDLWYVTATHNVHEAKMKNDQQAPDNSLSIVPPGCINLSGAGISSRSTRGGFVVLSYLNLLNFFIWIPDSTVIHDIQEEEMENGQIPPDGLLSNSDSPELINVTGHPMPPNALGSFSYDFTSLSNDELIYKPDINEFAVGTKNYSVSAGDPPVTAMSSVETVPNTPQISPAMAKKINDDIKYQLMKEVRRFGRNYERIFILLGEVQGSMKVKRQFVEFTIKEAARFKKVVLIQQLEKVLKEIDSHCHLRKVKHMRKK
uniref:INTS6/SAGE1/DDX26B/CT45 C-terminal domain-containing protein n=1 Tax=Colobus angolensis palliatus TaxID=336983 RepID=A0A2K5K6K6_COLAP